MISVEFIDQFAATAPRKPAAERDVRPARNERAFDRTLKDASAESAPPTESTASPPKPKPSPETDAAGDATGAAPAEPAVAPATEAVTQEARPSQGESAKPSEQTTDPTQPSAATEPADTGRGEPRAVPIVSPVDVTAPVTRIVVNAGAQAPAPQPTNAPAASPELVQPVRPEVAPTDASQNPVATEQARPVQNVVTTQDAVAPVAHQTGAPRNEPVIVNSDDTETETPDPVQPPTQQARSQPESTQFPGARSNADASVGDAALRDAATRQQVRAHAHQSAAAQSSEAAEAKATAQTAAQTTGGSTSPAAELARALLPEAGLDDLPAPANFGSASAQASASATSGPTQPADPSSATTTIRGATIIDAHDSGGGFRLDASGQASSATPVDRLTNVLASSVTPRSSFIRLQLDPPDLGQLRIEVRMNQDALTLRVQTETAAVKGLIEERMGELKAAMHQQGIRVDRVDVDVKPQSGSSNARGEHQPDGRDAGAREQSAAWDQPRNTEDWRRFPDGEHVPFGADMDSIDDARASSTATEHHFVTTESSVDVLI